jgi:preprotein translocase subunit SecG
MDPSRALYHAINAASGLIVGGFAGAQGNSFTSNLLYSSAIGAVFGGLNSTLSKQRFLSKQTLVEAAVFTLSSVGMHIITKHASDRRLEPQITFAVAPAQKEDCAPCRSKAWAERVTKGADEPSIQR